jgi:hypothetical protein
MTVLCQGCKFHVTKAMNKTDVWYSHTCSAPEHAKPLKQNPVSGKLERLDTYCRDANKDCDCPHFSRNLISSIATAFKG